MNFMSESLALNREQVKDFVRDLAMLENMSSRTCELYAHVLEELLIFNGSELLTSERLRLFIQRRGRNLQASTLSLWISALKRFLDWAFEKKYCPESLAKHLVRPRVAQKQIRVFDEEDLKILLSVIEASSPDEQLLFELLYGSGLRISEALALDFKNFDLAKRTMSVLGKGRKRRRLPLSPRLEKLVGERRKEGKALWENATEQNFRKWVKRWGVESGFTEKYGSFHPHKLRHSIATHLVRRGAKLPEIQRFLGHKQLQTTVRYTHLNLQDLCKVYDEAFPQIMQSPFDRNKK
jgi:integrase/recombinase XerC